MTAPYRSGLLLRPPHGSHGHTLRMIAPADPGAPPLWPARPALFVCVWCYVIAPGIPPTWCTARLAALPPGNP